MGELQDGVPWTSPDRDDNSAAVEAANIAEEEAGSGGGGGVALGETNTTAYRGDRGKAAYDHSLLTSGNPHAVTKTEVGLSNADNTSDEDKPVSDDQQTALDAKLAISTFGAHSIVKADSESTPVALTVGASTVVGRKASGAIVAMTMDELRDLLGTENDRVFATGEAVSTPGIVTSTAVGLTSQILKLRYFTARKTETINTVAYAVGGTAAGATPTISRIGIWEASAAGALTALVGSTANDTALFTGSTNTDRSKALSSAWNKVRGVRYAIGFLCVTGATAPSLMGNSWTIAAFTNRAGTRWAGQVAAQPDLPTTLAAGSVSDTTSAPYADLLA